MIQDIYAKHTNRMASWTLLSWIGLSFLKTHAEKTPTNIPTIKEKMNMLTKESVILNGVLKLKAEI